MKNNQRGVFIVLEGLDKCGKSTQCELLSEALEAKKLQFPDRSTSMSLIISDYLKGKRDNAIQTKEEIFSQIMELINDYNSMPQIIQLNNFGVELSYFIHFIIYLNLAYNFFFFNFQNNCKIIKI